MVKEKLLQWKYYKDKIPLYLQNSFGYSEHFKLLWNLLCDYDEEGDNFLKAMNITNTGELGTFNCSEILDNFARLYNISFFYDTNSVRSMNINNQIIAINDTTLTFLILVKIAEINFDGTRKTFLDFYKKYFDGLLSFYIDKYMSNKILVVSNINEGVPLDIIYQNTNMLFIDIMGVEYVRTTIDDVTKLALFDNSNKTFDSIGARFL